MNFKFQGQTVNKTAINRKRDADRRVASQQTDRQKKKDK